MSRKSPRFVPPGSLVEITARTVGARFLLRPSAAFNALVLATLGRALAMQPIDLHAIAFMSNHWHSLVSVADALALSRFVQFVHGNIARGANSLYGWDGRVFRKASFIVVGRAAEESRLRYVLSQGAKEGLVRRPIEWPGVHCARALIGEEVLVGAWCEREHKRKVRTGGGKGGGRVPSRGETMTQYPIDFAPLPSWRELDVGERFARVRRILLEVERDARRAHPIPLGVSRILAQDPLGRPAESKRGSAPPIHTPDEDERSAFLMQRHGFLEELHVAREAIHNQRPAVLPAACFPPTTPFRPSRAFLWCAVRDDEAIPDEGEPMLGQ